LTNEATWFNSDNWIGSELVIVGTSVKAYSIQKSCLKEHALQIATDKQLPNFAKLHRSASIKPLASRIDIGTIELSVFLDCKEFVNYAKSDVEELKSSRSLLPVNRNHM